MKKKARLNCKPECRAFMNYEPARSFSFFFSFFDSKCCHGLDGYIRYTLVFFSNNEEIILFLPKTIILTQLFITRRQGR